MSKVLFVGLDVHADTIAVAVAESGGEIHTHGVIPNRLESIRKLVGKLGLVKQLKGVMRPDPEGMKPWTKKHLECIKTNVHFEQSTLEATLQHYLHEVEHIAERILKLEKAIDDAVKQSPPQIRAVIEALQALRGVAQTTAASIVS